MENSSAHPSLSFSLCPQAAPFSSSASFSGISFSFLNNMCRQLFLDLPISVIILTSEIKTLFSHISFTFSSHPLQWSHEFWLNQWLVLILLWLRIEVYCWVMSYMMMSNSSFLHNLCFAFVITFFLICLFFCIDQTLLCFPEAPIFLPHTHH